MESNSVSPQFQPDTWRSAAIFHPWFTPLPFFFLVFYWFEISLRDQIFLQGMDVIFSVIGLTNNSVMAVLPQILSRLIIVKLVFPYVPSDSYSIVLTTVNWCISELIRFPFYTIKAIPTLQNGFLGSVFGHLRYNAFIIVYPLGVFGELLAATHGY